MDELNEWNGRDWYVACGNEQINKSRQWEDFSEFNFISAGGGERYSKAIRNVPAGSRVFVHIPKRGYVGVGETLCAASPIQEGEVYLNNNWERLIDLPLRAKYGLLDPVESTAEDLREFVIPVQWIKAVPREDAYWETGMQAFRHAACKFRDSYTLHELRKHFGLQT